MPNFNQDTLDAHLQALASDLTPEQQAEFTQRVKQRALDSDVLLTPDTVDGAASLLSLAANDEVNLPDSPGGEQLSGLLSHLNLPDVSLGGVGELAGSMVGNAKDGAGWLFSNALGLISKGGDLVGGAGSGVKDLAGSAGGVIGSAAGGAKDLAGSTGSALGGAAGGAMDLAGSAGSALGSAAGGAMDLAGSAGSAIGDVGGHAGDLLGGAGDLLSASGDVAEVILGALGDVLGSLDF